GQIFYSSYAATHHMLPNSADAARVDRIAARLTKELPDCPYKLAFHVEQSPGVNAFAMPGGNIIVYSHLIDSAATDDELACVLSHEIGHVIKRHSLRAILHDAGALFCLELIFAGRGRDIQVMLKQALKLDQLRYSRAQD